MEKQTLGQVLTEYREKNALSQQDLANRLGVCRQAYIKLEKDITKPQPKTIRKLAFTLHTNIEFINTLIKGE